MLICITHVKYTIFVLITVSIVQSKLCINFYANVCLLILAVYELIHIKINNKIGIYTNDVFSHV